MARVISLFCLLFVFNLQLAKGDGVIEVLPRRVLQHFEGTNVYVYIIHLILIQWNKSHRISVNYALKRLHIRIVTRSLSKLPRGST